MKIYLEDVNGLIGKLADLYNKIEVLTKRVAELEMKEETPPAYQPMLVGPGPNNYGRRSLDGGYTTY